MELSASTPSADSFAIGLWQSVQPSWCCWCTEPIQSWRAPPRWQARHTPVCASTGVLESRVKAMIKPGLVGSLACAEPGPWQVSHAAAAPVPATPARNACTCSEWEACTFSSAWQATQLLAPIATASGASGFFAIGAPSKDVAGPVSRKACARGWALASASLRMSVRGNIRLKSSAVNALAGSAPACGLPSSAAFPAACAVIVGSMRLKSCSVSALEETAGWATCAAAYRATSSVPATANGTSSAMADRTPALRTIRSEEAMIDIGKSGDREIPAHLRHGIVWVQAFLVLDADVERRDAFVGVERVSDAARRVLAEHRVFAVDPREGLLVLALDGRLHRGPQRAFDPIEQGDQVERRSVDETHPHPRDAALGVRRRDHAACAAQPRQHGGMVQRFVRAEIRCELLLDQLARQRGGSGAGRGIHDLRVEIEVEGIADQGRFDGNRIGPPAVMVAAQRLPAHQLLEVDADARAVGQVVVRSQERTQQRFQHARVDGFRTEVLVRQQVQARHVDAAPVRAP